MILQYMYYCRLFLTHNSVNAIARSLNRLARVFIGLLAALVLASQISVMHSPSTIPLSQFYGCSFSPGCIVHRRNDYLSPGVSRLDGMGHGSWGVVEPRLCGQSKLSEANTRSVKFGSG